MRKSDRRETSIIENNEGIGEERRRGLYKEREIIL